MVRTKLLDYQKSTGSILRHFVFELGLEAISKISFGLQKDFLGPEEGQKFYPLKTDQSV